jgi:hypothetical protein
LVERYLNYHYQRQTDMPTLGYWKTKGVSIAFLLRYFTIKVGYEKV